MSLKTKLNVFDYTNYRSFLSDYYSEQKKTNPNFSFRYFSKYALINSIGLLKDVIDGKRGLGPTSILKFSKAMGLKKQAGEYFEKMVFFNDANSIKEKEIYFKKMMESSQSKSFKLQSDHFEFFSKWYYATVREVLSYLPFDGDFKKLAKSLNPNINAAEAKKAIQLLEKLGFIKKDDKGKFERVNPVITTGSEVKSLQVANFQNEMMKLSLEAIHRHPKEHRDMSTLTLSVDNGTFNTIKQEIVEFRQRILNLAHKTPTPDRVYQVNFQLFPLSSIDD